MAKRMKQLGRFLVSGLMLTAVSLLLRTVGVSFHAFITARIGAAATGLYQLTMSVYSPALTLATAGVNLAASRLVAEELGKRRGGHPNALLSRCLIYAGCVSAFVGIVLFALSPYISAHWLGDQAAKTLLQSLSVGLPFIALSSAMNGYFTAVRRVSRTALVQLTEQLVKILLTLFLLSRLPSSKGMVCLIVVVFVNVLCDILSYILTACLCRIESRRHHDAPHRGPEGFTPRILAITLPVSISSFLRSGLVALEHLLIPRGLKKSGASYDTAMASYGALSGMAMPILLFPASFLYSFLGLLIPELAEANERNESHKIRSYAEKVLQTVLVFGIGAAGILFGFSRELGMSIYRSSDAVYYLAVLAPLIPIMYLDTAVDSMLKGLGEQVFTMKVNVLDALVSVCAVYFLVPKMGIMGYVVVIVVSEMINFSFSLWRLRRVTGVKRVLLRHAPLSILAAGGALVLAKGIVYPFSAIPSAVIGIGCSVLLYLLFLIVFDALPLRILKTVGKAVREELSCRKEKGINTALPQYNEAATKTKEQSRAAT